MKSKLIGILLIIAMMLMIIPANVFATGYQGIQTNGVTIGGDAAGSSAAITERIVGTLQVAGTIISVIALIVIGMRYMFSSLEGKAQMKGVIGYYIAGCILVFATSNVLGFAYSVLDDIQPHTWVEVEEERENSTCTTEGSVTFKCQDDSCGETAIQAVPALGHDWNEWNKVVSATCTTGSEWTRTCNRCAEIEKETRDDAKGHKYDNWEIYDEQNCDHGTKYKVFCARTGCDEWKLETVGTGLGHKYGNVPEVTEATCVSTGKKWYTCERCGKKENETVTPALGHRYSATPNYSTPATCTSPAVDYYSCLNGCGTDKTESDGIFGTHLWLPAGCTSLNNGKHIRTMYCSDCGSTYDEEESCYFYGNTCDCGYAYKYGY